MSSRARIWFGATALVVLVGLAIQLPVAVDSTEGAFFDDPDAGVARGFNTLAFFTIQANLAVGASTLLLALGYAKRTTWFMALRLIGVVGITLTFIVFHAVLRDLQDLTGQAAVADFLLHTVSPLLCVSGWLLFGPRGLTSRSAVLIALTYLVIWGVFTLVRGDAIGFYPYPFMDPTEQGYARVALNLTLVAAVFVALAAGVHWLDGRLARRSARHNRPNHADRDVQNGVSGSRD